MYLFYLQITLFLEESNILAHYAEATAPTVTNFLASIHSVDSVSRPIQNERSAAPHIELQISQFFFDYFFCIVINLLTRFINFQQTNLSYLLIETCSSFTYEALSFLTENYTQFEMFSF